MAQHLSGTFAITVVPQAKGWYVCEVKSSGLGRKATTKSFHGQTAKHAIAIALENLAHAFRTEAEAEQGVDWEAVDKTTSAEVINKRFHVILHYERVVDDESKFGALQSTLLGNTVVENAEVTLIQVAQDLPDISWKRRFGD